MLFIDCLEIMSMDIITKYMLGSLSQTYIFWESNSLSPYIFSLFALAVVPYHFLIFS